MFRGSVKSLHFVGIGGIGMSGIAEVLLNLDYQVTGSDMRDGAAVQRLRTLGAHITVGHAPENVDGADVVIRSTAVSLENVEIVAATRAGVPVIRRAEMLAELMRLKYGVAVAGSHGKTTTTSMLAATLDHGGLDPTVVIGGKLDSLGGTNARLGLGEYMVAEADESDGTFLLLSPTVAIVTNIDPEHLDHYGSVEALEDAFLTFTNRVPFYGFGVMCVDHPVVQSLLPNVRRRVVTYGFARHADYRAAKLRVSGVSSVFDVYRHNVLLGEVCIDLPGKHNVSNALAAIATSVELSVPFEEVAKALNGFSGLQRRFSLRGDVGGVKVIDDYAHHPVEIQATLEATMAGFRQQRIFAIFQPHRYSRASDLWDEFCAAFNGADNVLVLPVYAAGESPIDGINHHAFAEALRGSGHRGALAMDTKDAVVAHLIENVVQGDIVITLGAGDVNAIIEPLLAGLEQRIGN